jgi:DnaJ-domain-containing protein 1
MKATFKKKLLKKKSKKNPKKVFKKWDPPRLHALITEQLKSLQSIQ